MLPNGSISGADYGRPRCRTAKLRCNCCLDTPSALPISAHDNPAVRASTTAASYRSRALASPSRARTSSLPQRPSSTSVMIGSGVKDSSTPSGSSSSSSSGWSESMGSAASRSIPNSSAVRRRILTSSGSFAHQGVGVVTFAVCGAGLTPPLRRRHHSLTTSSCDDEARTAHSRENIRCHDAENRCASSGS